MQEKVKLAQDIISDDKLEQKLIKETKGKIKKEDIKEDSKATSPLVPARDLPAILRDCEVPNKVRGHWNKVDKERWLNVTEHLLRSGVKSSREMSSLTGINHVSCNKLIKEVKESWQSDLTSNKVNVRREELYSENERIANFCWDIIQQDPLAKEVPQFLKIIGDTNTRRSRLVGAEQITLAVGQIESSAIDTNIIQTQAAAKLGVPVSALRDLGDIVATKMIPNLGVEVNENEEDEQEEE